MSTNHGGSNHVLDFSQVGVSERDGGMEPKVCEWCGRQFFRLIPPKAKEGEVPCGQKHCGECLKKVPIVTPIRERRKARPRRSLPYYLGKPLITGG
jgi:hypothetical protein